MGVVYKAFDPRHRARRRDQDGAQGPASIRTSSSSRWRGSRTRPARGRPAPASEHRQRLRIRRGRGQSPSSSMEYVEGTGLREYLDAQGELRLRQLVALIVTQLLRRARLRARARRRPSRHQAGEPDPHRRRHAEGRRFRHRAHRHVEPDHARHGDGHAVVHVARAMPGPGGRSALGPVQRRRSCSTKLLDRREAVRRRDSRRSPTRSATKTRGRRRRCRGSTCLRRSTPSWRWRWKSPDARFQNARASSRALREALNAPAQQNPDETAATQINTGHPVDATVDRRAAGRGKTRSCAPSSDSSRTTSVRWPR